MINQGVSRAAIAAALVAMTSSALAAPSITVTPGGTFSGDYLDFNGNWVWNVRIATSDPVPTGSTPLASELGFTASGESLATMLISAQNLSEGPSDDFSVVVPGAPIFGWELNGGSGMPEGIQTNCPAGCTVTGNADQVFAALESVDFTTVGPHDFIQIVTRGPSLGSAGSTLSSTLTISGAYSNKGRISELDEAGSLVHYDTFANVFTRRVPPGDINLDGDVSGADLNVLLTNFNVSTDDRKWYHGNLFQAGDRPGDIDGGDLAILLTHFPAVPLPIDSSGGGSSAAAPEPASAIVLAVGFAHLSLLFVRRRS